MMRDGDVNLELLVIILLDIKEWNRFEEVKRESNGEENKLQRDLQTNIIISYLETKKKTNKEI
jgi:hypothetical protein